VAVNIRQPSYYRQNIIFDLEIGITRRQLSKIKVLMEHKLVRKNFVAYEKEG
jgi:hypothetical protein